MDGKIQNEAKLTQACSLKLLPNSVFNALHLCFPHFCYLLVLGIYIRFLYGY